MFQQGALTKLFFGVFLGIQLAHSATLVWNPNPESDLAGYFVYTRYGEEGEFNRVDVGLTTSHPLPALAPGVTMFLNVSAYNFAGMESELSDTVSYSAASDEQRLMVSWEESSASNVAGYRVSYGELNQVAESVDVGPNRSVSLPKLKRGGNYFVYVRALDSVGKIIDEYAQRTLKIPLLGEIGELFLPRLNKNPKVSLAGISDGATITLGDTISLTADASDPDGSVARVVYSEGSTTIGSSTSRPFKVNWTPSATGTFQLAATAFDNDGASARSANISVSVVEPVILPRAPSTLRAVATSQSAIRLTWNDTANDEAGFHIYRASGGGFSRIATVPSNSVLFHDSGLLPGTSYQYRVVSYNHWGESAPSSTSATTFPPVPAAPSSLMATALGTTSVRLTWNDESPYESGFKIYRSMEGGPVELIATLPANTVTFTNSALASATTYLYLITAFNLSGESDAAAEEVSTGSVPPASATAFTATALSDSAIRLSWKDRSDDESGFHLYRAVAGGGFKRIAKLPANSTSYTDSGLSADTAYEYRLSAYNGGGESSAISASEATLIAAPAAPSGFAAAATSPTAIRLTWKDQANNESGFHLYRAVEGGAFTRISTLPANSANYNDTGLSAGTTYQYRLVAYNGGGESGTVTASETTLTAAPSAPGTLKAVALSTTSIRLTWKDQSNNESGFHIYRAPEGGSFTRIATIAANSANYSDTGLSAGTTYQYRASAYNTGGESSFVAAAGTTFAPAPAAPSALTAEATSTTAIRLTWKDQSNNESGFYLYRAPAGGTFVRIATLPADSTTYTNTGLTAGTAYQYWLSAYNISGESSAAGATAATLAPAPAAPAGLSGVAAGNSVQLTWSDKSNNETGFYLYRSSGGGSFTRIATLAAGTRSHTDSSLKPGTRYDYRVTAFNGSGESGFASTSVSTFAAPAAPESFRAIAQWTPDIRLTWIDAAENETGYYVERSVAGGSFTRIAILPADTSEYTDFSLQKGVRYDYRLSAFNGGGESDIASAAATTLPF